MEENEELQKRVYVIDELCNGCRACEIWCAFSRREEDEFNPTYSRIKIVTDADGAADIPLTDCTGETCQYMDDGQPLCVQMCPTGSLVYTDLEDFYKKRKELLSAREKQPLFKLIAPWKWPYPWREWQKK